MEPGFNVVCSPPTYIPDVNQIIRHHQIMVVGLVVVLSPHKWSGHKWSGGTIFDIIGPAGDHLCCHKWSPWTTYAKT